ncbi:hypothetical protein [Serinibacter arcticus]|nr:hypothetical protein [Serinibacter arcticus]
MALRYNPPPSWPTPPRGWTPTPDWTPPADFPPLPAGWELWVDDDAPAATSSDVDPEVAAEAAKAAHETETKRRQSRQTWTLLLVGGAIAIFVIAQGVVQIATR